MSYFVSLSQHQATPLTAPDNTPRLALCSFLLWSACTNSSSSRMHWCLFLPFNGKNASKTGILHPTKGKLDWILFIPSAPDEGLESSSRNWAPDIALVRRRERLTDDPPSPSISHWSPTDSTSRTLKRVVVQQMPDDVKQRDKAKRAQQLCTINKWKHAALLAAVVSGTHLKKLPFLANLCWATFPPRSSSAHTLQKKPNKEV